MGWATVPRRLCKPSCSFTTRPLSLTSTPCHVPSSASVSQLSLHVQLAPLVEMNSATSASRSVEAAHGTYRVRKGVEQPSRKKAVRAVKRRAHFFFFLCPLVSLTDYQRCRAWLTKRAKQWVYRQSSGEWYFVEMVSVGACVRDGLTGAVSESHQCDFWHRRLHAWPVTLGFRPV